MWMQCVKLLLFTHLFYTEAYNYIPNRSNAASSTWQKSPHANYSKNWSKYLQNYVKLRHAGHSKYPHLDGVLNRLNKIKSTAQVSHWKSYYKGKNDDNYDKYDSVKYLEGDLDDEISKNESENEDYDDSWDNEDEDKTSDYDENEEGEDDDYSEEDENENWQAEEATSKPISSLTEYKWAYYGTRSKVEETRRNHFLSLPGEDGVNSAVAHIRRMNVEGKCSQPKPKVINIQSEHPNPEKRYLPPCTVLYRCSEDTGCCTTSDTKCQPKKQALVHLYFYTNLVGQPSSKVEKLAFYNHTECTCLKISANTETSAVSPENLRSGLSNRHSNFQRNTPNLINCNCPEVMTVKRNIQGKCFCDCSNSDIDCMNMRKGKEHFSLKDRRCILDESCGTPSCEYGTYLKHKGRCPKKQENKIMNAYASI